MDVANAPEPPDASPRLDSLGFGALNRPGSLPRSHRLRRHIRRPDSPQDEVRHRHREFEDAPR